MGVSLESYICGENETQVCYDQSDTFYFCLGKQITSYFLSFVYYLLHLYEVSTHNFRDPASNCCLLLSFLNL